jgi:hypothetical protein
VALFGQLPNSPTIAEMPASKNTKIAKIDKKLAGHVFIGRHETR